MLAPLDPDAAIIPRPPSIEETLRAAAGIRFPDDLARRKAAYSEAALRYFEGDLAENPNMPPIGEWPASPNPPMGLSVVRDILTGKPLPKVHIALAPTDDWTTIPAYLRWGGWNDCPAPEFHVAAMRTWRDRYGAELVGLNADTINLRVATKPATRKEALALARDHYIYCTDVIDQGVQTYSAPRRRSDGERLVVLLVGLTVCPGAEFL